MSRDVACETARVRVRVFLVPAIALPLGNVSTRVKYETILNSNATDLLAVLCDIFAAFIR